MENSIEEDIKYLKQSIPMDDIYDFTNSLINSAIFLILKLKENVDDFEKLVNECETTKIICTNMNNYCRYKLEKKRISIHIDDDCN